MIVLGSGAAEKWFSGLPANSVSIRIHFAACTQVYRTVNVVPFTAAD